jgi:phosphoglucosamine mutase
MGLFFGTDGLRGIVNADLTFELAYKCGNALASVKPSPRVIIGRDTRVSGEYLTLAVAGGVMSGGGEVIDLGVIPTSGVAYLARELSADYGVVISASHNPREYNGIKVFDSNGYKLSDKEEEALERRFIHTKINDFPDIGRFSSEYNHVKKYESFLEESSVGSLEGMKIVLDCANGAACRIAPAVFRALGASVVASASSEDGMKINDGVGALYPEHLIRRMERYKADVGFAFDGDADRLIAVDKCGKVIDGDMLIYMLARNMKKEGRLRSDTVVGTSHTNMAIEQALARCGIGLIRTDIGDKYVLEKLLSEGLSLGGEQSGHIILKDIHSTGDGILSAIATAGVMRREGASLSEMFDVELYPQANINVTVSDKLRVINSESVNDALTKVRGALGDWGRVMLRASGTEPKVRIMVESPDGETNRRYAEELEWVVRESE